MIKSPDTHCKTGANSGDEPTINDKECVPSSTVVGYMGGSGKHTSPHHPALMMLAA